MMRPASKIITNRRALITGLISLIAAPAIVRAESLMPIRTMPIQFVRAPLYIVTSMSGGELTVWAEDAPVGLIPQRVGRSLIIRGNCAALRIGNIIRFT